MDEHQTTKIWLVATGEYSDYGVVAVFDDQHKADAEEFAKLVGGEVEEHPCTLNPTHQKPPVGKRFVQLQMDREGKSLEPQWYSPLCEDGTLRKARYVVSTNEGQAAALKVYYWRLNVWMYARDVEHAVKVANEIRIQILAGAKPTQGSIP